MTISRSDRAGAVILEVRQPHGRLVGVLVFGFFAVGLGLFDGIRKDSQGGQWPIIAVLLGAFLAAFFARRRVEVSAAELTVAWQLKPLPRLVVRRFRRDRLRELWTERVVHHRGGRPRAAWVVVADHAGAPVQLLGGLDHDDAIALVEMIDACPPALAIERSGVGSTRRGEAVE